MKKQLNFCYLLFIVLTYSNGANAQNLFEQSQSVYYNNKGAESLVKENYARAQKNLLYALKYNRKDLIARLNIAFSFELMGDREKAVKEYELILNESIFSERDELFYAYFNLAKSYGDLKNIELALENYQRALDIQPESIEVKTNIELLLQQEGGGGGEGDQEQEQEEPQDGEDENQEQPQQPQENQQQNPEDLNQQDIQQIFEELKNQEQKIRELEYGEGVKQNPGGKDW